MKNFSNSYIFLFSAVMVVVVAAGLSVTALALKSRQEKNTRIEIKRNILSALGISSSAEDAENLFDQYIRRGMVVDASGNEVSGKEYDDATVASGEFPLYEAAIEGRPVFVIPLNGKGLWGKIWGYAAISEDGNTLYGVTFSHAGETPGLGAEIATPEFQAQFRGKKIFDSSGAFAGIRVLKSGSYVPDDHSVDAVSGGTITSNGLRDMVYSSLRPYVPFFEVIKSR